MANGPNDDDSRPREGMSGRLDGRAGGASADGAAGQSAGPEVTVRLSDDDVSGASAAPEMISVDGDATEKLIGDGSDDGVLDGDLAVTGGAAEIAPEALSVGDLVGRYRIQERLGAGTMGVVYKAHDPELDRLIALKILRASRRRGRALDAAKTRLHREAQALAQLSHPNVITVYDVGTYGVHVFVAMEFVEGQTLSEWLANQPRPSQRELLEVFLAAGQGLAAAHGVGLVHRDFKPENVVVGDDGRVRVLDFGLARAAERDDSSSSSGGGAAGEGAASAADAGSPAGFGAGFGAGEQLWNSSLTRTDFVLGTPAYMAPEQHMQVDVDERSDQFSFCVALYWALYGEPPFTGRRIEEIGANAIDGRVNPAPRGAKVPGWLRAIVLRGLAAEPEQRYDSMNELLEQLRRGVNRRQRIKLGLWIGLAAMALLGVGGALSLALQSEQSRAECLDASARLAEVWGPDRSVALDVTFAATERPHGAASAARVRGLFDDYGRDWVDKRVDACEATHVRGEQSEALLMLRLGCLERGRRMLGALAEAFVDGPDGQVVDHAISAAYALPALDICADESALLKAFPLPAESRLRTQIGEIDALLDQLEALRELGQASAILELAREFLSRADATEHPPLQAKARYLVGVLSADDGDYERAAEHLSEAARLAAKAGDDRLIARSWLALIRANGLGAARYDNALALRPVAEIAIARAGDSGALKAQLLGDVGAILTDKGELEAAQEALEQSVELARELYGGRDLRAIRHQQRLAYARTRAEQFEDAVVLYQQLLIALEPQGGSQHPLFAQALGQVGDLARVRGECDEAIAYYQRAHGIYAANFGDDGVAAASMKGRIGHCFADSGRYSLAADAIAEVIAADTARYGPESAQVGDGLLVMARLRRQQGQLARARELAEQAVSIHATASGAESRAMAAALVALGGLQTAQGQPAEAIAVLERALALNQKSIGAERVELGAALHALGVALTDVGRLDEARQNLERAREVWVQAHGPEHRDVGRASAALARVERRARRFAQALKLWQTALDIAERTRGPDHPQVARLLTEVGVTRIDSGQVSQETVAQLERALSIWRQHDPADVDQGALGRTLFALARALDSQPGAGERAAEQAAEARAAYEQAEGPREAALAAIDAWLAERR